jgi:hypothetical protein
MPFDDPAPSASAAPAEHADWLELKALASQDRNSSISDLGRTIERAGTMDAMVEDDDVAGVDPDGDGASAITSAAFFEIESREQGCGTSAGYAFDVGENSIEAKKKAEETIYVFLLLLARYGHQAAKEVALADSLFEEVSAAAVRGYMGGTAARADAIAFGPTRRKKGTGFRSAVDDLCSRLGEGGGISTEPAASDQKDAKLDVVAWTPFPDSRRGKLVMFGQCATGKNWPSKLTELQPHAFCGVWMREPLHIVPHRAFFLPFTIPDRTWNIAISNGGIVFDRCRIAAHATDVPAPILKKCRQWSKAVMARHVVT